MTTSTDYKKPIPRATGDTQPFWDFCKQRELRFQKCSDCGTFRHYPRPMCGDCGSLKFEWVKSTGKGKVYTWVTAHRAFHPGFQDELPLPIVIIDVEDAPGVRMMGNFNDGTKATDLKAGMLVQVVFEQITPELTIPKFKKASK